MIMKACNEQDFSCALYVGTAKKKSGRNYIYCEFTFRNGGLMNTKEYVKRELPASKYDACVRLYDAITRRIVPLNECKRMIEAL